MTAALDPFGRLNITSPKRRSRPRSGWDLFFPYYAGYPTGFAEALLESAQLPVGAVVLDPWNGSGTTTQAASRLGLTAIGCDLNPVMIVVAKARSFAGSDGDVLSPLAAKIISDARSSQCAVAPDDPLLQWYDERDVEVIRILEHSLRSHLLGTWVRREDGTHFESMSSIAAVFYVALFTVCRTLVSSFQASNPTWLRRRKPNEALISVGQEHIHAAFEATLAQMSLHLQAACLQGSLFSEPGEVRLKVANSTDLQLAPESVDFVLTSPPYCTRIDYTAATRIELAILSELIPVTVGELSRNMLGTVRVSKNAINIEDEWGPTCAGFLESVRAHPSKASHSYYLKNHLDYFHKLSRSLGRLKTCLKEGATGVIVVQDSHYKDVYNNLPKIVAEMVTIGGFKHIGSKPFHFKQSMAGINPYTRLYKRTSAVVESVVCFQR